MKKNRFLLTLVVSALLLIGSSSYIYAQKTVMYTGGPIVVKVAYLNASEIVFEGDEIASVIVGFPAESISLQNTANSLFLQPLVENLSGDIYIVNRDGKSKIISIVPTLAELRDRSIRVINSVQEVTDRIKEINNTGLTPAGLIRAMMLGQDIDGVSIAETRVPIIEEPIKLIASTVYDAFFLRGYIVDMTGYEDYDIRTISMRGLLAGSVRSNKGYFVLEGQ